MHDLKHVAFLVCVVDFLELVISNLLIFRQNCEKFENLDIFKTNIAVDRWHVVKS